MRIFSLLLTALPLVAVASGSVIRPRAKGDLGSYCTKSTQCTSGPDVFCNRNRCDTQKPPASRCYKDNACLSGTCTNGRCDEYTKNAPIGAYCLVSSVCRSDNCEYWHCQKKKPDFAPCYKNKNCRSGIVRMAWPPSLDVSR
jgi:hypothetical protein